MASKNEFLGKQDIINYLFDCDEFETKKEAKNALEAVLHCLKENLISGKDLVLVGFGKFNVKECPARIGHNPRTGEKVNIPASKTITFKVAATLKEALIKNNKS